MECTGAYEGRSRKGTSLTEPRLLAVIAQGEGLVQHDLFPLQRTVQTITLEHERDVIHQHVVC